MGANPAGACKFSYLVFLVCGGYMYIIADLWENYHHKSLNCLVQYFDQLICLTFTSHIAVLLQEVTG